MNRITVTMRDGTERVFNKEIPGNPSTNRVVITGGWVIVEDVYGERHYIPTADIDNIHETGR